MGWNSAGDIFGVVARALVEMDAAGPVKTRVTEVLVGYLRSEDWDTETESLEYFLSDPDIVEGFRRAGGYRIDKYLASIPQETCSCFCCTRA